MEINYWLKGIGAGRLAKAFAEIDLVTGTSSENAADRSARIQVMARRLSGYPEDLVLKQLRSYRGVFFPKLDDIRLPLERSREYRERLGLKRAFEEALRKLANGESLDEKRVISDDERAIVAKKFAAWRKELGRVA